VSAIRNVRWLIGDITDQGGPRSVEAIAGFVQGIPELRNGGHSPFGGRGSTSGSHFPGGRGSGEKTDTISPAVGREDFCGRSAHPRYVGKGDIVSILLQKTVDDRDQ